MHDLFQCPFNYYAGKTPKAPAISSENGSFNYCQAEDLVQKLSAKLLSFGIKKGDTIAFESDPFISVFLLFALFRIGATAYPLSPLVPQSHIANLLDRARVSALIGTPPFLKILPPIKQAVFVFPKLQKTSSSPTVTGPVFLEKKALATLTATSGTTGEAKIAAHSIGNHYYSALGSGSALNINKQSRYLLALPTHHIAGIAAIWRTFLKGATLVIQDSNEPLSSALLNKKITHASAVQTQLIEIVKVLEKKGPFHHHLHAILLGGSELSQTLCRKAWQLSLPIMPSYGCTEMSSTITALAPFSPGPFSAGSLLAFRKLKVDAAGRIFVKGKTLFQGYLKEDGSLKLSLDNEGYFYTGDRGFSHPKSGLTILGREDRMFISGGENIYPEEIELALLKHPYVAKASVTAHPDTIYGHVAKADVTTSSPLLKSDLTTFLKNHLHKYKIPKYFDIK